MENWEWELTQNAWWYRHSDAKTRRDMEIRALQVAANTIHTSWRISFPRTVSGKGPALPNAKTFLLARLGKNPSDWQRNEVIPKVQFARALLGFRFAGCVDLWQERRHPEQKGKVIPTLTQWQEWLDLYPKNSSRVKREHAAVLEYVRTGIWS